jgi:acyl-CoA thioester hydrolase
MGNSSVRYALGIFREGEPLAAAEGYFVHVYVERTSNRPVSLPQSLRDALEPLKVSSNNVEPQSPGVAT